MQTRGPPPNGKYENFGRLACCSGVNRSGSNRSGSGNQRGVAVHRVLAQEHDRPRRDRVAAGLERPHRAPADDPRRRIQPHRLGQHHPRVGQEQAGRPPTAVGRLTPSRSPRACGASTSGCCDSRYHVHVSAFAVVSCPARKIVIASSRSCRSVMPPPSPSVSWASSSIESRSPRSVPLRRRSVDETVDRGVEASARLAESQRGGKWEPLDQRPEGQIEPEVERLERRRERFADLGGFVLDVGVEQRLADDRERQRHHFLMRVDGRAGVPAVAARRGVRRHRRAVGRDALAMERRLRSGAAGAGGTRLRS